MFKGMITGQSHIKEVRIHLSHAEIPVSFYNITTFNNVLDYHYTTNPYLITLTPGNYNFNTLSTALINGFLANGHTFLVSISKITGLVTFMISSGNFTLYDQRSTMFTVLGFTPGFNYGSTNSNLTAQYPLNLLGTTKIKIKSEVLWTYSFDSSTNGISNTLATMPVDQPSFGLIIYENKSVNKYVLKVDILDEFDLQLTDQNDILLNFNNQNWTLGFILEFDREVLEISPDTFKDILKKQQPTTHPPDLDVGTDDLGQFMYMNTNLINTI